MSKQKNRIPKGVIFVRTTEDETILIHTKAKKGLYTTIGLGDKGSDERYLSKQLKKLVGLGWCAKSILDGTDNIDTIATYIVE